MRQTVAVAAALAGVVLLAGCAGEPESTEANTATAQPEPTESSTPEPEPTTTAAFSFDDMDDPESSESAGASGEDAHWLDGVLDYPEFDEVDPYTSGFFVAIEDEGSDPVTYLGGIGADRAEFLWDQGVEFCEDLDDGDNSDDFGAALEALDERSGLGESSAVLAGAAVTEICEDHKVAARIWAEANN